MESKRLTRSERGFAHDDDRQQPAIGEHDIDVLGEEPLIRAEMYSDLNPS